MTMASRLLTAAGGGVDKLYVDDVFSAYTYTGNGATQTITNGIDLAGKGGLVWTKTRDFRTYMDNIVFDTARGVNAWMMTNTTGISNIVGGTLSNFNNNGFTLGAGARSNESGGSYVAWTFRKAPKFFDVVTYTGNGVAGRQIPHALGIAPGMVIVKSTNTNDFWYTYHRSLTATKYIMLNDTAVAANYGGLWDSAEPTVNNFTVGSNVETNGSGRTFVAYLFAHDTSADGIVQCGSFTANGSGQATISLGWEPQYVMMKSTNAAVDWFVLDTARPWKNDGATNRYLSPNTSSAEASGLVGHPTSTGFYSENLGASNSYIYLAIRMPNKPPTLGTQVYNAIARNGTNAATTVTGVGFAPDLATTLQQNSVSNKGVWDRLRGGYKGLFSDSEQPENNYASGLSEFTSDGIKYAGASFNSGGNTYINHFFKRAPGVFDVVCYTGTGVARTVPHSLGVAPELMIVRARNDVANWLVYASTAGASKYLLLNTTDSVQTESAFFGVDPTNSVFSTGLAAATNRSAYLFVAYLFASKAGVSKVTSFVGNGTSQTIDCGFTTGARFVMVKATSTTGSWLVGDSTRGLVAGNDPRLSLNTTAAEVTTEDWLDPHSSGFIVNQVAGSSANASGVTYLVLAFS